LVYSLLLLLIATVKHTMMTAAVAGRAARRLDAGQIRRGLVQMRTMVSKGREKTTTSGTAPPLRFPTLLLSWYSKKLDVHPLKTKMLSAAFLAFWGDVLSQKVRSVRTKKDFQWDIERTAKFGFLGFIFIAPLTHIWYGYLLRKYPGTTMKSVITRVAIDQFFFEPIYIPTFLSAVWTFEGEKLEDIKELLVETAPKTLVANWAVWIPATTLIFKCAQPKYHVLAANMVGFLWNAYVSFTAHAAEDEHCLH
jgi:hypothetical protein